MSPGCSAEAGLSSQEPGPEPAAYANWADPLAAKAHGAEHNAEVCAREGDDLVRSVFCDGDGPNISSLRDLQTALGIDSARLGATQGLSVAAHSTALSGRSVSSINPRVIAVRLEARTVGFATSEDGEEGALASELLALAFVRGEQWSELVVRDRRDKELRFYLVAFRQACNDSATGCTPGDLLTPEIERDWTEATLYDEDDLKNTLLDCAPCHQPEGPGTAKLLRMQELQTPWTHWFFRSSEGGVALIEDYVAAKGEEELAAMSAEQLRDSHPGNLSQQVIFSGSYNQPNEFLSEPIEEEVKRSAAALGGTQPHDNSIPGDSPTWRVAYQAALRGDSISVPYHDVKVTDPSKLARMSEAYRAYQEGAIERAQLPDIRDVFPDEPERLAAMGMMTEPGSDGETVLRQACGQCHNGRLDPTLSRARFRADLVGMNRAEKERAIQRMILPESDLGVMPPSRLRRLSPEARQRAIAVLKR